MSAKSFFFFLIFILLGILQSTDFLKIFGIKPNLLLIFLIAIAFFIKEISLFLNFILLSMILSLFENNFGVNQLALAIIGLTAFFASRRLPWSQNLNNLFLIVFGTILFYLLASPSFLINSWSVVLMEIIYNLIAGTGVFALAGLCLKTNSILKT